MRDRILIVDDRGAGAGLAAALAMIAVERRERGEPVLVVGTDYHRQIEYLEAGGRPITMPRLPGLTPTWNRSKEHERRRKRAAKEATVGKGRLSITKEEVEQLRADMAAGTRRGAYGVVFEDEALGREKAGWYLCLAVENSPGYHQLAPGYGPYESHAAARRFATELNEKLGLSEKDAALVVASTMFGDGVERR